MRKKKLCPRCGKAFKPSEQDAGRCDECFAPRVEVKFPQDDEDVNE